MLAWTVQTWNGNSVWATALILALLKTQLDFFLGKTKGNGTLETQGFESTEIKLSATSHPPVRVSENSFSHDITRNPLPLATGGDK